MYSNTGFDVDRYVYDVLHPENNNITLCKTLIKKSNVNCSLTTVQHVVTNKLMRRVMLHLLRQVVEVVYERGDGKVQMFIQPFVRQPAPECVIDMIHNRES